MSNHQFLQQNNWLVYPLSRADQQQHIEQSEQLLAHAQPHGPAILSWSMAKPTGLVLGFSQKQDVLHAEALHRLRLPIYHRRAGGTAVLVGPHLLSLDVVLPARHPLILPDVVESYRWFGEAWVAALQRLGVQARTVLPPEAHAQQALRKQAETRETGQYEALMHRACYGTLSPYEVVVGQRKVVGLDMIRRRTGTLLQAGVLLHWDTELLAQLLGHNAEEQALLREGLFQRAIGLDVVAGRTICADEVIAAFHEVLISLDVTVYSAPRAITSYREET